MLQRHGGGEGGDGLEAIRVNLLEKSRHQWPGCSDKQGQKTGDDGGQEDARRPERGFGQLRAPAQIQYKQGDRQLPQMCRQVHQQPRAQSGAGDNAGGEGSNHLPVDVVPGEHGTPRVGAQLDHAVYRNDRRRRHPRGHQYQQQNAAADAQNGGQHRGDGRCQQQKNGDSRAEGIRKQNQVHGTHYGIGVSF